jgi:hypothetical protein
MATSCGFESHRPHQAPRGVVTRLCVLMLAVTRGMLNGEDDKFPQSVRRQCNRPNIGSAASLACARPQLSVAAQRAETGQGSEATRGSRRGREAPLVDYVHEQSWQYQQGPAPRAAQSAASLLEAAERSFYLGLTREVAALGLSKSFQDSWKMRRIDFLRLARSTNQGQHGKRDVVLTIRGQAAKCKSRRHKTKEHSPHFLIRNLPM